ncbi:hypothetical protein CALVIDRAFT_560933 [Calocera viscosa TUFC12733]|uniref:Uncharacterized protein n=1 Tax=Calocera viscosa (strain TUFC12733) TaxID=1330018 RepID=A0A167QAQ2_CALVF|nr:hypothetical protein CALVIDRAFT_560933 [Calocera viscosa TUFC12733]
MSFRQRGFGAESPTDYFLRRMLAGRFLLENPSARDEVFKAMERTPLRWRTILGSDRMASVGELLPAVQDNEEDLLQAVRNTNLASDFEMLARQMERIDRGYGRGRDDRHPEHNRAEVRSNTAFRSALASTEEAGSGDELAALAAFQRTGDHPRPAKTYRFPKDDSTRSAAPPPGPCYGCGSKLHRWRDCCHYDGQRGDARRALLAALLAEEDENDNIVLLAGAYLEDDDAPPFLGGRSNGGDRPDNKPRPDSAI